MIAGNRRALLLIVGVVVVVVGLVLSLVPLTQSFSQGVTANTPGFPGGFKGDTWNISGYSLTGEIPMSVSWTANTPVSTLIEVCTGGGFNPFFICLGTPSWPGNGTGTSGSASFSVKNGATLLVAEYSQNGTTGHVSGEIAQTTIGLFVVAGGLVLVILGLVLKNRKKQEAPIAVNYSE